MSTPLDPKKKAAQGVPPQPEWKTATVSSRRRPAIGKFIFVGVGVLVVVVAAAVAFVLLNKPRGEVAGGKPAAVKTGKEKPAKEGAGSESAAARAKDTTAAEQVEDSEPAGPEPPVPAPPVDTSRLLVNSIGMKLVLIPAGEFDMGASDEDAKLMKEAASHEKDPERFAKDFERFERPRHHVRITKPFYIGAFEVTQGEYEKLGGKKAEPNRSQHPVVRVSWMDAFNFCQNLSKMPQESLAHRVYRLPTEAEWEYACRAGTSTAFCGGNDLAKLTEYAWMEKNPRTVGQKKPNAWGLFDMHGNAREWCWDWFVPSFYESSPEENPLGPPAGRVRAVRGGSEGRPFNYRSAARGYYSPTLAGSDIGFRVVCQAPEGEKAGQPTVDKLKKIEFDAAIQAALAAMKARDLSEAKKQIATAKAKAQLPEDGTQVTRYQNALAYLEEFWRCIRGCIASLKASDEIDLADSRLVVLKSSAEGVTLKIGDREIQHTWDTMPTNFVIALADSRLAKDPQTKVIFGVFLALDPLGDAERAAQLWAEAAKAGEKVEQSVPPIAELAGEHAVKRSSVVPVEEPRRKAMTPLAETPGISPETVARMLGERLRAIQGAGRNTPADESRGIFNRSQALVREAMAADLYDLAVEAGKIGSIHAGRLRERALIKQAHDSMQEAQKAQKAFAEVSDAKKTLAKKPDDPEANLAYGGFLCFVKNNWATGLPLLKKSSNKALAKLAAQEETVSKPEDQLALADGWLEQVEEVNAAERKSIQVHAGMCAYRASALLSGPQKAAAEKRAKQAGLVLQITNTTDGSILVLIPEGKFQVGESKMEVYLPAYYLGLYEVSMAQYARFVQTTGHDAPPFPAGQRPGKDMLDHPIGFVSYKDATDYCRWAGLRLPTADEWEKGARGIDGRRYPWGKDWDPIKCRNGLATAGAGVRTFSVTSYPEGRSPWGLFNMSGNVWEWCTDTLDRSEEGRAVRRGGGFDAQNANAFLCSHIARGGPNQRAWHIGFRVARDYRP